MRIKILILKIVLGVLKPLASLVKRDKKKVTFISLESDVLEGNFLLLYNELKERGYHVDCLLTKFEKSLKGNFLYFLCCIKQLFILYASSLVIIDFNNYVVSNYKPKELKVLQIWHSSGCIKKFGNETDRDYVIANYDYVIANADAFKPFYSRAFGVEEENVVVTGIPVCDGLINKEIDELGEERIVRMYNLDDLNYRNKKIILYAPTFRGRLMKGFKGEYLDLMKLRKLLPGDYLILYKMHPLMADEVIAEETEGIINVSHSALRDLFAVTDILISDYSALIFDYSTYVRPMYFFAKDLDSYKNETGIFLDYEKEMPGEIYKDEDKLAWAIINKEYDLEAIRAFKDKYATMNDGHSLERCVDFIENIM